MVQIHMQKKNLITSILGSNIFFNNKHSLGIPTLSTVAAPIERPVGNPARPGKGGCARWLTMGGIPRTDAVGRGSTGLGAGAIIVFATLQSEN